MTESTSHSSTVTLTQERRQQPSEALVLTLEGASNRRVQWSEGIIDNEFLNKKKSKCCCIYSKPRAFGESSSSSEDELDENGGKKKKKKKSKKCHHNHNNDDKESNDNVPTDSQNSETKKT